jgi:hypothetical protein
MLEAHANSMNIPYAAIVKNKLKELFKEACDSMKEYIAKTCRTICFSLDIWTSKNNFAFLIIVGHWIMPDFKYKENLLAFTPLSAEHMGENLALYVSKCVTFYGLEYKLLFLIGDNASNNATLARHLERYIIEKPDIDSDLVRFKGKESLIECLAHQFNLIIKDLLTDSIYRFISVIEQIAHEINVSPQKKEKWYRFCNPEKKKLIERDVDIQWNSIYRMLKDAFDLKDVIKRYCKDQNLEVISKEQWKLLSDLIMILGLFNDITLKVSASEPIITQSLQIYFIMYLLFADIEIIVNDGNRSNLRNK